METNPQRIDPAGNSATGSASTAPRRIFLKQVAVALGAAPLALGQPSIGRAATVAASTAAQNPADVAHAWRFLSGEEARALEAAVARIIPADDDGPGAKEAGVAAFIGPIPAAAGPTRRVHVQPAAGVPRRGASQRCG